MQKFFIFLQLNQMQILCSYIIYLNGEAISTAKFGVGTRHGH